jgi:hypothetical protein
MSAGRGTETAVSIQDTLEESADGRSASGNRAPDIDRERHRFVNIQEPVDERTHGRKRCRLAGPLNERQGREKLAEKSRAVVGVVRREVGRYPKDECEQIAGFPCRTIARVFANASISQCSHGQRDDALEERARPRPVAQGKSESDAPVRGGPQL